MNGKHERLLDIQGVKKHFPVLSGGLLRRALGTVRAVDGISFYIGWKETVGLVGESGCGKTTTAKMVLLLEKPTVGDILFDGKSVEGLRGPDLKHYRRSVQAVFQDPWSSLDPRQRVGSIVAEPLEINGGLSKAEIRERVAQTMMAVGLNPSLVSRYPHEFSGGQRQRIALAQALAPNPSLVVLDEPVSSLDVSIQAQVMNLLKDLQEQFGASYLLIAHNLGTVQYLCQRVMVMYLGRIVEEAESQELFAQPVHPYTQALISAALPSKPGQQREEIVLTGEVPSPLRPPSGCRFHTRCPIAISRCAEEEPPLQDAGGGHRVACWRAGRPA